MRKYFDEQLDLIILRSLVLFLFYFSTVYRITNLIALDFFLGVFAMLILNIFVAVIISAEKKILIIALMFLLLLSLIALLTPAPLIPYFN